MLWDFDVDTYTSHAKVIWNGDATTSNSIHPLCPGASTANGSTPVVIPKTSGLRPISFCWALSLQQTTSPVVHLMKRSSSIIIQLILQSFFLILSIVYYLDQLLDFLYVYGILQSVLKELNISTRCLNISTRAFPRIHFDFSKRRYSSFPFCTLLRVLCMCSCAFLVEWGIRNPRTICGLHI